MAFFLALLALTAPFARADDNQAPQLRYQFSAGKTNAYSIQVETRGENGRETLSGNIFVTPTAISTNVIRLSGRGSLTPQREAGTPPMYYSGSGYPRSSMPVMLADMCEIQIDDCGRVLRESGDYALSVPLGQLLHSLVEPFPAAATSQWDTVEQASVLDDPLWLGPASAFLGSQPYGQPYFYSPRSALAVLAVSRHSNCKITAVAPETVAIHKEFNIVSWLQTGAEPRISASGEGEVVFDRKAGMLKKIELTCKSVVSTETVTRRTAVVLRCQLLEGPELEEALKTMVMPSQFSAHKLTAEELQKVIADLKSTDSGIKQAAAARLVNAQLDAASPELLDFMVSLLSTSEGTVRQAAANIIAAYGTRDHVPVLLKLLKAPDFQVRQAAIKGLGRLKDKRACEPLAEALAAGGQDAFQAVTSLVNLGPEAEESVLRILDEKNIETRRQACNILRQIGTGKSVNKLKKLMVDPDQMLSQAAAEAVRAIQAR